MYNLQNYFKNIATQSVTKTKNHAIFFGVYLIYFENLSAGERKFNNSDIFYKLLDIKIKDLW